MTAADTRRRRSRPDLLIPLSPSQKWRTITIATLVLVPSFWGLVTGLVSAAATGPAKAGAPNAGAALALGFALVPFVFIALAFIGGHPHAPGAVLKAMGLAIAVGAPVAALAGDAVTGIVAGVGAGGVVALRVDVADNWRARAFAVGVATIYAFVLVHTLGAVSLFALPVLPLTGIGLADHWSERERGRRWRPLTRHVSS